MLCRWGNNQTCRNNLSFKRHRRRRFGGAGLGGRGGGIGLGAESGGNGTGRGSGFGGGYGFTPAQTNTVSIFSNQLASFMFVCLKCAVFSSFDLQKGGGAFSVLLVKGTDVPGRSHCFSFHKRHRESQPVNLSEPIFYDACPVQTGSQTIWHTGF